jgi:hypothetical protein
MRSIAIKDLDETTDLDQAAMAEIRGGMDVRIESVSSTVRSTDDNSVLSPELLGGIVNAVIDSISQQSHKGTPH